MTENPNREHYKPVGEWSGRLLFDRNARLPDGAVLMEVNNAPMGEGHEALIGTCVELGWDLGMDDNNNSALKAYVDFLTTDVNFQDEAIASSKKGRIHPERLNGLEKVGPLESLAGARPDDSIHVVLLDGTIRVVQEDDKKMIKITKPPIQIRGRLKCLAKFVGPEGEEDSDDDDKSLYKIQHYNPQSQQFDGPAEVIHIPKFPLNAKGLAPSTSKEIEKSPVNEWGWYIYGHFDDDETTFVVEAWEPRRAVMISGDSTPTIRGLEPSLDAIKNVIWTGVRYQKGTINSHLLDPSDSPAEIDEDWKEGDRCLVIHLFGGIGGDIVSEENPLGIIPGHFAFGNATIVRDTNFTQELQFQIVYRQVYAHNNGGIISGPNMWSSYCGDLERGWLATRPISDFVVKLDVLTKDYSFDFNTTTTNTTVCPLDEVIRELNEMAARYRSGDGDGSALVSTAHSCVQDSNQALFAALHELSSKLLQNPKIQAWETNPDEEQQKDMEKLQSLYQDFHDYLTPMGIRQDWTETAKGLRGTEPQNQLLSLFETMRTWRTVVPRRAHDRLAEILLDHGAKLWFIRTNQVGGNDPHIFPLAAARAFCYHDNKKDPAKESQEGSPSKSFPFFCM